MNTLRVNRPGFSQNRVPRLICVLFAILAVGSVSGAASHTAAAGHTPRDISTTTQTDPSDPFYLYSPLRAVFALGETCEASLTGVDIGIYGGMHANGLLRVNPMAADNTVVAGPASYVDAVTATFDKVPGLEPYQTTLQPDPLADIYRIEDYRPGGAKALAAGANYYSYNASGDSSCAGIDAWIDSHITNGVLDTGLYYTPCSTTLTQFDNISGTVTWVFEGQIQLYGNGISLTSYSDDLLFFSTYGSDTCAARSIRLAGSSNNSFTGDFYAPHGEIHFGSALNDTTVAGCLTGYQVSISGSRNTVACDLEARIPTFSVTTTADSGPGSLRQAILDANAAPGKDLIAFDIPGTGPHTIQPLSTLPDITDPVIIDGTTQPGASCDSWPPTLQIEIPTSLVLSTNDSLVRGLALNGTSGLQILGGQHNVVTCNFIGTDITGSAAQGQAAGILLGNGASANRIGTNADMVRDDLEANVISGNDRGILLFDNAGNNSIAGNRIGLDATGTLPLGNRVGITITSAPNGNRIGGSQPAETNLIAYNSEAGILVFDAPTGGSDVGNTIVGNRVFANGGLGIDLSLTSAADGVTLNDPGDVDTGPNALQNYPELGRATPGSVHGDLISAPDTTFTLHFYSSTQCDPSGYGEGEAYLGSTHVTTASFGEAAFNYYFDTLVPLGHVITATATGPAGNTSEFSACSTVEASQADAPRNFTAVADSCATGSVTFVWASLSPVPSRMEILDADTDAIVQIIEPAPDAYCIHCDVLPPSGERHYYAVAYYGLYRTPPSDISVAACTSYDPTNNPPQIEVPGSQITPFDTPLVFSTLAANAIQVDDPDAETNPLVVTLAAERGTLTLSGTAGLSFSTGDGTGDDAMTFTGTLVDINAALDGLRYEPAPGYTGADILTVTADDQGYTGTGGPQQDSATVAITVLHELLAPSGLTASAESEAQITLAWTGSTADETAFYIERSLDGANWEPLGTTDANTPMFTDSGLTCGTTYSYRVRGYRSLDNAYTPASDVAGAATWLCAPALVAPENGTITSANRITFEWASVEEAAQYQLQVAEDAGFTNPLIDTLLDRTSFRTESPLVDGAIYYWRVLAIDADGNTSVWSDAWTLGIDPMRPMPPRLRLPRDHEPTSDTTPWFKWKRVSTALHYNLQVATDPAFSSIVIDTTTDLRNHTVADLEALPYGVYWWRVRAQNEAGFWSDWSLISQFQLTLLKAPKNARYVQNLTPTFRWFAVIGAQQYQLQLASDSSFNALVLDEVLIEHSFVPQSKLPLGQHWWRVRAQVGGVWSAWSPAWSMALTPPRPTPPALIDPIHGIMLTDRTPEFHWAPVASGITYQIRIDDNRNLNSPLQDVLLPPGVMSYTATPLPDGGHYFWRVRAINAQGVAGQWSARWRLTLNRIDPPLPLEPLKRARMTNTTPTLTWTGVSGAVNYQVEIALDSEFRAVLQRDSVSGLSYTAAPLPDSKLFWRVRGVTSANIPGRWSPTWILIVDTTGPVPPRLRELVAGAGTRDTTPTMLWQALGDVASYDIQIAASPAFDTPLIEATALTNTFTVPGADALNYGRYFWRVRGTDMLGNVGTWSVVEQFDVTLHKSPRLNAAITNLQPIFDWASAGGATAYEVELDDDPGFGSRNGHYLGGNTYFEPVSAMPDNTYYWRVRVQKDGVWSEWMPAWHITITTTKPARPILASPVLPAVIGDSTPALTWNAVDGATSYRIQIDDDRRFISPDQDVIVNDTDYIATRLSDGDWYWRVRALNAINAPGRWSAKWYLTVDTVPPDAPLLIAPLEEANIISRPRLSWAASPGATRYEIWLYAQSNPLPPIDAGSATSYTPPTPLNTNHYEWQVRAVDKAGNTSDWSESRTFVVVAGTSVPSLAPEHRVLVEAESDAVQHQGMWLNTVDSRASGGLYVTNTMATDALTLHFDGYHVDVFYVQGAARGMFDVYLDGMYLTRVDSADLHGEDLITMMSISTSPGGHTLRIVPHTGTVSIDKFEITTTTSSPITETETAPREPVG